VDATGSFGGDTNWTFYHLTFGDNLDAETTTLSGTGSITANGNLTVAANQTLTGSKDITVNGGNATGDGPINLTGGTFTLDDTGNFGGASGWTFYDLTFGDGTDQSTTTAASSGNVTSTNVLTISDNQYLKAGTITWRLSGSGTPFVITGIFQAESSIFKYIATSATNISTTTYYQLELSPSGAGSPIYTTQAGTITTNDYIYIGDALNTVIVTATTNDTTLNIIGNFEIKKSATFVAPPTNSFSVAGNWTGSGIFSHASGTVLFDATASRNITATTSDFYQLEFNGSSGQWTFIGPATSTATTTITEGIVVQDADDNLTLHSLIIQTNGVFTKSTTGRLYFEGIDPIFIQDVDEDQNLGDVYIGFSPATTNQKSDIVVDNFTVNAGDTHNTRGYEINSSGSVTIYGTLDATDIGGEGDGTIIYVGASWLVDSGGTFTADTSTTTFDGTSVGNTIDPGGSSFNNLHFNGSGGSWTFNITSATATNDFTISNGSTTAPSSTLYIGGNWLVKSGGTFSHNSATVLFDATEQDHTIIDGGSPFYNITFNGSGGGWLYQDATSTAPNQTTIETGIATFLNAKTGSSPSITGGELLVDWYLGAHVVDAANLSENIDTADNDITISEATASSTVWRYVDGIGWGDPFNSTTTDTDATGINSQPGTTGAIRIREYRKTATENNYYEYNLQINSQTNYGEYNYYNDYGNNYLISSSTAGTDNVIGEGWHRNASTTINSPYTCPQGSGDTCVNNEPTNGSWYIGMMSGLTFEISSGLSVNLGTLDDSNNWTANASSTLQVTTSASNGYVVTAWAVNSGQLQHINYGTLYVQKYDATNGSPEVWDQTCTQNSSCCGFGYTTDDSTLSGGTANRFISGSTSCTGGAGSGSASAGFATSGAGEPVADFTASTSTDQTIVTYKVSTDSAQSAGNYQTTVIYIATANY